MKILKLKHLFLGVSLFLLVGANVFASTKYYAMKCLVQEFGMTEPAKVKIKNSKEIVATEKISLNQYVLTEGWLKDTNMLCVKYRDDQGASVQECSVLGIAKESKPSSVFKVFKLTDINAEVVCRSYQRFLFF